MAIDGSFFKAHAAKSSLHTSSTLKRDLKRLDKKIATYKQRVHAADRQESKNGCHSPFGGCEIIGKAGAFAGAVRAEKKQLQEKLKASRENQTSTVDPYAYLLKNRSKTVVGYNVQIAVDDNQN